jgi:hypothetical protein
VGERRDMVPMTREDMVGGCDGGICVCIEMVCAMS